MSKFRYYPTLLDRAQRMMKAGLWAEPAWYEGLRRSPPMTYGIPNKEDIPKIKFEEDELYKSVLKKKPLLKLQQINPYQLDGNLAWQFARHQFDLIKKEKIDKQQAYHLTEQEFKGRFDEFYEWLDESRINYRLNMEQKERQSRAQASIMSEILERKLNVKDIFEHPLQKTEDSIATRKANLQRLNSDPGITAVKELYTLQELPIIQALEGLLKNRNHPDVLKYNNAIKTYIKKVNHHLDRVYSGFQGDMALMEELKELLPDITLKLTYTTFVDLTQDEKSGLIRVVQLARKCKVVDDFITLPKVSEKNISVPADHVVERERLRSLRDDLEAASFLSEEKAITTKINDPDWFVYREEEWYRRSPERKFYLHHLERIKKHYEQGNKQYAK